MSEQVKIFAAVFRKENTSIHDEERVEYFCKKDIDSGYGNGGDSSLPEKEPGLSDATPELYATNFLLEEGEWLDTVVEEDAITDPVEVIGILENALEYIRIMTENGADEREIELRQQIEKLLVSYVATHE